MAITEYIGTIVILFLILQNRKVREYILKFPSMFEKAVEKWVGK